MAPELSEPPPATREAAAALAVFTEHTFEGTRMAQVAERAGRRRRQRLPVLPAALVGHWADTGTIERAAAVAAEVANPLPMTGSSCRCWSPSWPTHWRTPRWIPQEVTSRRSRRVGGHTR